MTMICIPITAGSTRGAVEEMGRAEPMADLLEIRVDYIKDPDLDTLLGARTKPVIVTITPRHEGLGIQLVQWHIVSVLDVHRSIFGRCAHVQQINLVALALATIQFLR